MYKLQKWDGVGPSWAVTRQKSVLAWRSVFHSSFKFLHKNYLFLGNIKIIINFVSSTPVLLSKRLLTLKVVENLHLPSVGVLLLFIS
jgi:hypothetical protein